MPTRAQVEDALIEVYSREARPNPKYDRKRHRENDWVDEDDNPEFVPATREERLAETTWTVFTASDGYPALAPASIAELVQVLVEAGLVES